MTQIRNKIKTTVQMCFLSPFSAPLGVEMREDMTKY